LKVQVVYRNKKLEVTDTVEYDLNVYCLEQSDRLVKLLGVIESLLGVDTLKDNEAYQKVRHTILDVSGSIRRLPDNLLLEPGQKIIWEDELTQSEPEENQSIEQEEKPQKLTMSLIQKLFGKAGD
jgi:hypothetical protein